MARAPAPTKLLWQKQLRGAGLSATEYMVLLTLSTYADENLRHAHPGWARLAADTGLDVRTIKKAAASLQERGFILLTEWGGNQYGKGRANEFAILPIGVHKGRIECPPCDEDEDSQGGHSVRPRGASGAQEGGHPVTPHQVPASGPSSGPSSSSPSVTHARAGTTDRRVAEHLALAERLRAEELCQDDVPTRAVEIA